MGRHSPFWEHQDCIANLKERGYQIIATTPHENDCMLEDFDISKPSALFFGTERHGLSDEVLAQADGFMKIPMVGFTESLNISVSAAIILQNVSTRLRHSDIRWHSPKPNCWKNASIGPENPSKILILLPRSIWSRLHSQK